MAAKGRVFAVLCGLLIAATTPLHAALVPLFADYSGDLLSGHGRDPDDPLLARRELNLLQPKETQQESTRVGSEAKPNNAASAADQGTADFIFSGPSSATSAAAVETVLANASVDAPTDFISTPGPASTLTVGAMISESTPGIALGYISTTSVVSPGTANDFTPVLTTEGVQNDGSAEPETNLGVGNSSGLGSISQPQSDAGMNAFAAHGFASSASAGSFGAIGGGVPATSTPASNHGKTPVGVTTNGAAAPRPGTPNSFKYTFPGDPGSGLASDQKEPPPPNVIFSDFIRSPGLTVFDKAGAFGSNGWPLGGLDTNLFNSFTVSSATGFNLIMSELSFEVETKKTGPRAGEVSIFLNGSDTAYDTFSFSLSLVAKGFRDELFIFRPIGPGDNVKTATFVFYGFGALALGKDNVLNFDNVELFVTASSLPEPDPAACSAIVALLAALFAVRKKKQFR